MKRFSAGLWNMTELPIGCFQILEFDVIKLPRRVSDGPVCPLRIWMWCLGLHVAFVS